MGRSCLLAEQAVNKTVAIENGAELRLPFGLAFQDLYRREGLARLDAEFLRDLEQSAPQLGMSLEAARKNPGSLLAKQHSELIIELAPYLEDFAAKLFDIETELRKLQERHDELAPLYAVKRKFVQRKALNGYNEERASQIDGLA